MWTITKTECQRIDAFELWCWRRLLRVPWTVRRSNQSILKETIPEHSLEGLKLKLQAFGHLMRRINLSEKTLLLRKMEGRRRRGQQRMRGLDGITINGHEFEWALGDGEGQGSLACCSVWSLKESETTEQQQHLWFERACSILPRYWPTKKYNTLNTQPSNQSGLK